MTKELEIWRFAARKLSQNISVMLLAVVESSGSSPGRKGFKMIVAEDEMCGSIGGGVMEIALVDEAKKLLKSKVQNLKSQIVRQIHRKNVPNSSGMICSGAQTVIFFRLNSTHLGEIQKIFAALENNQPCRLQISNVEFQISNQTLGNENTRFEQKGENEFLYEENLGFRQKLFIVGGGHCALALSELMVKLDFHITLFDDREDLNTLEKNRFAHEKTIIESYQKIGDVIPSGDAHYVVVMTLGYKFDELVIRRLFDKDFKYFGVLGSRAKMKTLLKQLENEGFDRERLKKIRTPVGLQINSRTPEEIAVSIAAEIIAVKNSAGGRWTVDSGQ